MSGNVIEGRPSEHRTIQRASDRVDLAQPPSPQKRVTLSVSVLFSGNRASNFPPASEPFWNGEQVRTKVRCKRKPDNGFLDLRQDTRTPCSQVAFLPGQERTSWAFQNEITLQRSNRALSGMQEDAAERVDAAPLAAINRHAKHIARQCGTKGRPSNQGRQFIEAHSIS